MAVNLVASCYKKRILNREKAEYSEYVYKQPLIGGLTIQHGGIELLSECKIDKVQRKDISLGPAVFCWFLTIGYMGLIFYLSSLHNIHLPKMPRNFDKVLHMCAYIPLAYLFYLSLKKSGMNKYIFILAVIFAVMYGITDELHQVMVPGRDASAGDLLADALGAFLGSLTARYTIS